MQAIRYAALCIVFGTLILGTGVRPAQAITDKEAGVAQEFLNWDVAWSKLPPYARQDLVWIPKAQSTKWTVGDAPFLSLEATIDQEFNSRQNGDDIVARYKTAAAGNSTASTRFALAYAALKRYRQTEKWRDLREPYSALAQNYVPSFEYTKLLLQTTWEIPVGYGGVAKVLQPVTEHLLKHSPNDTKVQALLIDILVLLPTNAARARAEPWLRRQTVLRPRDGLAWFKLASLYDQWWTWNMWLINHAKTPQVSAQARKAALRDANSALSAYNHVTAVAEPNGVWMRSSRATYENRILKWKKENGY